MNLVTSTLTILPKIATIVSLLAENWIVLQYLHNGDLKNFLTVNNITVNLVVYILKYRLYRNTIGPFSH